MRIKSLLAVVFCIMVAPLGAQQLRATVKVTSIFPPTVSLSCTPPATGATPTGYNFYRGTTTNSSCTVPPAYALVGSSSTCSFTDTTVTFSTNYCWVATATANAPPPCSLAVPCESVQSLVPAFAQTPANPVPNPPTGLSVGTITAKSVPLQWQPPIFQTGISVNSYNVMRCHEAKCPAPPIAATVTMLKYTDICNYSGGKCWYEITANDTVNGGKVVTGASNIVAANVKPNFLVDGPIEGGSVMSGCSDECSLLGLIPWPIVEK